LNRLSEEISPADEFHKIKIDGEVFQWKRDSDIQDFINQKYEKEFENWVFNASLSHN